MDSIEFTPSVKVIEINYTDIMADLNADFVKVYAIFAGIVLFYTLMNMFIFEKYDFQYREHLRQALNMCVLILSLFVCAVSIQYYFI